MAEVAYSCASFSYESSILPPSVKLPFSSDAKITSVVMFVAISRSLLVAALASCVSKSIVIRQVMCMMPDNTKLVELFFFFGKIRAPKLSI